MPIIKERLIDLINAGQYIEMEYLRLSQQIASYASKAEDGTLPVSEALSHIQTLCALPEDKIWRQSLVFRDEAKHWHLTHKRADKEKLYKQQVRKASPQVRPKNAEPIQGLPIGSEADNKAMIEAMNKLIYDNETPVGRRVATSEKHRAYGGFSGDPIKPSLVYICPCQDLQFAELTDLQKHLREAFEAEDRASLQLPEQGTDEAFTPEGLSEEDIIEEDPIYGQTAAESKRRL